MSEHHAQNHPHLGIVGQRLFRGAVDQPVEIDHPAQDLGGNRAGESLVFELAHVLGRAVEGDVERFTAAQDCIEQAQRSAASMDTLEFSHWPRPYADLRNAASTII